MEVRVGSLVRDAQEAEGTVIIIDVFVRHAGLLEREPNPTIVLCTDPIVVEGQSR